MARLGYLYKGDLNGLTRQLDHLIDLASQSLEKKREVISWHMDSGLFPIPAVTWALSITISPRSE